MVGVTGGIAAYKGADLVSQLVKRGAEVHVIMTASAQQFITPLTLQTLSKNQVITDMFAEPKAWEVQHISLADKADLMLIVPATANIIGKIANGIADDMLTTTVMATNAPVLIAPAMNVHMYENPIVQANIKKLASLGYSFIEPDEGLLACGYQGKGRLAGLENMLAAIEGMMSVNKDLENLRVLVTAGPTREKIDPVRFISNHSTGKMGYAIAEMAAKRGAKVVLISGHTDLNFPANVEGIRVESARDMYDAVMEKYEQVDAVIKTAAVADYRPKTVHDQKVKKQEGDLELTLERNPDILFELGQRKKHHILVGFAAETENLQEYARQKLFKKKLDMIVANNVAQEGAGFRVDTNQVELIFPSEKVKSLPLQSKKEVANLILDEVKSLVAERTELK